MRNVRVSRWFSEQIPGRAHFEILRFTPSHPSSLRMTGGALPAATRQGAMATDWPSPGVVSIRKNVEEFRGLGLGEEVERKVLWENATRLFG